MEFTAYNIAQIEEELKKPLIVVLQDQSFRNLALFYKYGYEITLEQAYSKIDIRLKTEFVDELWSELIEMLYDMHFLSKALNLKKRAEKKNQSTSEKSGQKQNT